MTNRRGLLLGAIVGLAMVLFYFSAPNAFELFELQLLDYRLRSRPVEPGPEKISVILVDERAMGRYGLGEKFKFALAELIEELTSEGVKVIALDIIFPTPRDNESSSSDRLSLAIHNAQCVVLGYRWDIPGFIEPFNNLERAERLRVVLGEHGWRYGYRENIPQAVYPTPKRALISDMRIVRSACSQGYVSVIAGLDLSVRTVPMAISMQQHFLPPFSVSIVRKFRDNEEFVVQAEDGVVQKIVLGDRELPVDMAGRLLLLPPGPPSSIQTYDFISALAGEIPSYRLKDGIVLIGVSAMGGHDNFTTSYGPNTPGVYVHAEAVHNMLDGRFLRRDLPIRRAETLIMLLLPIILGLLIAQVRPIFALLLPPIIAMALIYMAQLFLERWGLWFLTSYAVVALFSAQIVILGARLAVADKIIRCGQERENSA
ncbi:MAG: CHASE2 domain-containing protein [Candidatus Alcyoniella australis]|nr:CHASE2 domain-containing protein [Candidatus Alcyoniella australis]